MLLYIIHRRKGIEMNRDGEPWRAGFVRMEAIQQDLVQVLDSSVARRELVIVQRPFFD